VNDVGTPGAQDAPEPSRILRNEMRWRGGGGTGRRRRQTGLIARRASMLPAGAAMAAWWPRRFISMESIRMRWGCPPSLCGSQVQHPERRARSGPGGGPAGASGALGRKAVERGDRPHDGPLGLLGELRYTAAKEPPRRPSPTGEVTLGIPEGAEALLQVKRTGNRRPWRCPRIRDARAVSPALARIVYDGRCDPAPA